MKEIQGFGYAEALFLLSPMCAKASISQRPSGKEE